MPPFTHDGADSDKDPLEWTGHWWFPENPETKFLGVLIPNASEGPSLELMGSFPKDYDFSEVPLIHGSTGQAKYITLHNLECLGIKGSPSGQHRRSYRAEVAVTGEYFESPDTILFDNLRVAFSTLVHWVQLPLIDQKDLMSQSEGYTIKTIKPFEGRLYEGKGFRIGISYDTGYHSTRNGTYVDIHPVAYLYLSWTSPCPMGEICDTIKALRDFLAFATCIPTGVEYISARPLHFWRPGFGHHVHIFHREFSRKPTETESLWSLFSLKNVLPQIQTVLEAWFNKGRILQPIIDLRLASTYNPNMQAEARFMALAQALEAFHRRTHDDKELPQALHDIRLSEILAGTPKEHVEWLKGKLSYSNEPGLKKRLKAIFEEHADLLKHFKLERDPFSKSVFLTRNYFTHFDHQLQAKTAKGWDLWQLVYGLELLLDICLLDACGIDRKVILDLITNRHSILKKPTKTEDSAITSSGEDAAETKKETPAPAPPQRTGEEGSGLTS